MTRRSRKLPALSPSETEILRLVWQLGKATVQEVCNSLPAKRKIAYATVQTLLRRLEKKGYLKHHTKGKAHVFWAAVEREHVISQSVGDFLDRLFGGLGVPERTQRYGVEPGRKPIDYLVERVLVAAAKAVHQCGQFNDAGFGIRPIDANRCRRLHGKLPVLDASATNTNSTIARSGAGRPFETMP